MDISKRQVVITGRLDSMTRDEAIKAVKATGAYIRDRWYDSCDLIVVGHKPGSDKLDHARAAGIEEIDEAELCEALGIEYAPDAESADEDDEDECAIRFEAGAIVIGGERCIAQYAMSKAERIYVTAKVAGEWTKITLCDGDVGYDEARAVYEATREETAGAMAARRENRPRPIWLDTTIKGRGWKIEFDGGYDRVRVVFDRPPRDAVKGVIAEYGFRWSPNLRSWNRHVSDKAFRAAQELAQHLREGIPA